jgi:hypothetical protein
MTGLDAYVLKMNSPADRSLRRLVKSTAEEEAYYQEFAEFPPNRVFRRIRQFLSRPQADSAASRLPCNTVYDSAYGR